MRSKLTNWELQINCKYNVQFFPVQQCRLQNTRKLSTDYRAPFSDPWSYKQGACNVESRFLFSKNPNCDSLNFLIFGCHLIFSSFNRKEQSCSSVAILYSRSWFAIKISELQIFIKCFGGRIKLLMISITSEAWTSMVAQRDQPVFLAWPTRILLAVTHFE